jgi:hypothetical protein
MASATIPESVRDRNHDMIAAVHRETSTSGELRLLAAIVARSLADARAGDAEAVDWLGSPAAFQMIARLTPRELEPENVQSALLEAAGRPEEPQTAGPGRLEELAKRVGL